MKALVIDDAAINRSIIVEMLSTVGVCACEADSAQAGLTLLEGERFDLVVMDVHMPNIDGFEAAQRIRGMAGDAAQVSIIAVTGDATDACVAKARAAGADAVLFKPVRLTELLSAVAQGITASRESVLA